MKFILASFLFTNFQALSAEPVSGGEVNKKLLSEIRKANIEMIARKKYQKAEDRGRSPASFKSKD